MSSSIPAKQRNPGQRQIAPTKHFGAYHGSDKITQLATDILPGALTVSSPKPTMSTSLSSQDLPIPGTLPPPSNHFDMYVAEKASERAAAANAIAGLPSPGTIPGVSTSVASTAIPVVTASASSCDVIPNGTTPLSSKRVRAGLPPDSSDDDSISSSSSSVTPLNDATVPNNDFVEDESLIVAQGVHSDLFENVFAVRMSASNNLYRAPGTKSDYGELYGPVLVPSPTSPPAIFPLVAHAEDAVVLDQFYQLLPDSDIFILLYKNWNALHSIISLVQLHEWLESRQVHDHLLLVHLFAAYWNCTPPLALSFGEIKTLIWNCAQVDVIFTDDLFNVTHSTMALSTVTINFFLVRPIQQWVSFLAQHCISIVDCLPITEHMGPIFESLEAHVHPAFSAMVHFCSQAYRTTNVSEHLLHRQVSRARDVIHSGLVIALADAFVFQQSYFPQAYDYDSVGATASYMLLERAIFFKKIEILQNCNLPWARLLTKLMTTPESTCASWPASQLANFLFSLKPKVLTMLSCDYNIPDCLKVLVPFCANF